MTTEFGLVIALVVAMIFAGVQYVGDESTEGLQTVSDGLDGDPTNLWDGVDPEEEDPGSGSGSGDAGGESGGGSSESGGVGGDGDEDDDSVEDAEPTPTAVPPTATPVPEPTATPVPEPTATPVPEPTPTAQATPQAAAPISLSGGGFEDGRTNKWKKYGAGSTVAGGWKVGSGNVQTGRAGSVAGLDPDEGSRFIDLNGNKRGSLYQDLAVSSGASYRVTLSVAASDGSPATRSAEVRWNGAVVGTISLSSDSGWSTKTFDLPAVDTPTARLELAATSGGSRGVLVDNLSVAND